MRSGKRFAAVIAMLWAAAASAADPPREVDGFPPPEMNPPRTDVAPFTYRDVGKKIPNYTKGEKWGVQGEPISRMQEPLPAAEALKHLTVPRGFHVELFAADPDLGGKPLAMTWDERGRLWVAETYDYPNEQQPRGRGRDRIRICEDSDGDGRADKFTVFAEQLSIPTSIAIARGGAIVFDGPETVFLRDTNGDDVADERTKLFGEWSQRDTHAGASNMQIGLDNWIWATQGYNDSQLDVGGTQHRFRQGILRFKPDGSQLEFVRSTNNNTWGLGIGESGLVFASTANRNPSNFIPFANRYYEQVRGWTPSLVLDGIADSHYFTPGTEKVRQMDHFGGYTAACGHALYTARRYPREYWNRTAFVCEPTGHLVGTFVLTPQGAGFRSTNPCNLLTSDDEWSAPIMAEVGPDGNVWVLDWYNFIVQHNPTPAGFETGKGNAYVTDLRDKRHARVYRVVYGEADPKSPRSLAGASPEKLVETLRDRNMFWRKQAQRLLVERGQLDVLPRLIALVKDPATDEIGLNVGAIHALWTMHGLGALDGKHEGATRATQAALRHPSAAVRQNAVQVLADDQNALAGRLTDGIGTEGMLRDPDPQVRLAVFLALAESSQQGVGSQLIQAMAEPENSSDRWISEAAIAAAASNSDSFLTALGELASPETLAPKMLDTVAIVAEHRARSGPHETLDWLAAPLAEMSPPAAEAVIRGLAAGWPKDQSPQLDHLEPALVDLAPRLGIEGRSTLVQLAVRWGSSRFEQMAEQLGDDLLARASDENLDAAQRVAAARELLALRSDDPQAAESILDLITPRLAPGLAAELLATLKSSNADGVGKNLAARLAGMTPAVRSTGVSVLLARPAWSAALVKSLADGKLAWADLSLDQQRALSEHPDEPLRNKARDLLAKGGALPSADRRKVLDEMLPLAAHTGDVDRGREVFKKQCAKCHVHGSEGTRIGPDLTGMAVHPKAELLENILDPSRSVEGNFRVYTLTTTGGQVLTGLLAAESKSAVELFDAEGKKHSVLREEIDELVPSPKSLMPEGFEKQVTAAEITDLLEFLAARGKFLPLPLDKVATSVSTRGIFQTYDNQVERLVFDDWGPKTFAGVPFQLVDPRGERVANAIALFSPQGAVSARMPRSVTLPCNAPVRAIHMLGGISGWGYPLGDRGSVSVIVRLHYADGTTEDHALKNGEHFADFIRQVDVPKSRFAFDLGGRQLRYLAVHPGRDERIDRIELVKGPDATAPIVMAVTLEMP